MPTLHASQLSRRRRFGAGLAAFGAWLVTVPAIADEPENAEPKADESPAAAAEAQPSKPKDSVVTPSAVDAASPRPGGVAVTPTGYVEAYYAYNFNRPRNGVTNFRGFDNRHNTFTLANAVLGATAEGGPLSARLLFQVGSTPSTYYGGEPALPGASGANATSADLWRFVQEANLTYKAPVGRGLSVQMGLFPSPIGIEVFAVKDNWNWSRSSLFFALPFYHTGLRATYEWTPTLSTTAAVYNGWNSVVDNNEEKSVSASVVYKQPDKVLVQALYFGGIERNTGSPEGPNWRHHVDVLAQVDATAWASFAAQGDYGWEPTRMGTARWFGGALYARLQPIDHVFVAVRGDRFHEHLATDATGRASSPLFWNGVEWVSSATATVEARPHPQLSVRLELRHDVADEPLFFRSTVARDALTQAFVPNARTQDTLLLGATAWF